MQTTRSQILPGCARLEGREAEEPWPSAGPTGTRWGRQPRWGTRVSADARSLGSPAVGLLGNCLGTFSGHNMKAGILPLASAFFANLKYKIS